MKISSKYNQFIGNPNLIIVLGECTAEFFLAEDGEIRRLELFRVFKPKYSDKEGLFERSGHGILYGFGSVLEYRKQRTRDRFSSEFRESLKHVSERRDLRGLYLFVPRQLSKSIIEIINRLNRVPIAGVFWGNYQHLHETAILAKISALTVKENLPANPEARKLLEKSVIIRKILGR